MKTMILDKNLLLDLSIEDSEFKFATTISDALARADLELVDLNETVASIKDLKPECDKWDYILSASSGALCGIMDIFLVGKYEVVEKNGIRETKRITKASTDKWFENRTKDFAKLCGWKEKEGSSASSAIQFLEKKFKIPYDQRGAGDAGSSIYNLTPSNHHFKSLGHNPTLLGLFFSILDQFSNTSHFVSGGELIALQDASKDFQLRGNDTPSKLFCGFVNWFGHLISDVSGASGSKTRGMGIPSPFWSWINDVIAIKRKLGLDASEFDKGLSELALEIYEKGYDARFQAAQAIPVFVNELVVRFIYTVRRALKYFSETEASERSFRLMWESCKPYSNFTVKRMLTVAHGTFCLVDIVNATYGGFKYGAGNFNPVEFVLRLNIIGVGRFSVSLYGEGKRALAYSNAKREAALAIKQKEIVNNYMTGLRILADQYDDAYLLAFIGDFEKSDAYKIAFEKSVALTELRHVSEHKMLKSKSEIDNYFEGIDMTEGLSRCQSMQQKTEAAKEKTNQKIDELGEYASSLYTSLITIQILFDNIRNVPEESKLHYDQLKDIRINWKKQVEKIEAEYKKAEMKATGHGAAGVGAGITVAAMKPTAAMGIATTFGVASTSTAISSLSGVAATNAALAWLGGGALTVGGSGVAGGSALLALAGPAGWAITGVLLTASGLMFLKSRKDKKRLEDIYTLINNRDIKSYELAIVELNERITRIEDESNKLIEAISKIATFGTDYNKMTEAQQFELGAYVNLMEASTMLLVNPILGLQPKYTQQDFEKLCDDGVHSLLFVNLYPRVAYKKNSKEVGNKVLRRYLKEHETMVITLANLLYKVTLDDEDRAILTKSWKKNEDFLSSISMTKNEFDEVDILLIEKVLEYKYQNSAY